MISLADKKEFYKERKRPPRLSNQPLKKTLIKIDITPTNYTTIYGFNSKPLLFLSKNI